MTDSRLVPFDEQYKQDSASARKKTHLALIDWRELTIREKESVPFEGFTVGVYDPDPTPTSTIELYFICRDEIKAELRARAYSYFRQSGDAIYALDLVHGAREAVTESVHKRVWSPGLERVFSLYRIKPNILLCFRDFWSAMPVEVRQFVSGELEAEMLWPIAAGEPVEVSNGKDDNELKNPISELKAKGAPIGKRTHGFSQARIAALAGVSLSTFKTYFRGEKPLNRANVIAIEEALHKCEKASAGLGRSEER